MPDRPTFTRKPYPLNRRIVADAGYIARSRHMIHGLVEFDITEARRRLAAHKAATGESISFTAFMLGCLGHVLDQNRHMHAYKNWRGQLILFDDMDVTITIELEIDGHAFPLVYIMRGVNRRSVQEMHAEIRRIQAEPARATEDGFGRWFLRVFPLVPGPLRRMLYRLVRRVPHWQKQYAGTVGLTNLGMFGTGGGFGLGMPAHTLAVTVGGTATRPAYVGDDRSQVEPREFLSMTLSFDHDIIDGAPAARFTQRLKDAVEAAHGL